MTIGVYKFSIIDNIIYRFYYSDPNRDGYLKFEYLITRIYALVVKFVPIKSLRPPASNGC